MVAINRPAIEIKQGKLTLYLTYVTPSDLNEPDFYTVEKLDPVEKQGFQRMLDTKRALSLARDLEEAFPQGYANLPTSVFLATNKPVDFNPETNYISFDTDKAGPLSVVDGQHRLEGLKEACKKEAGLLSFRLPATIAVSLDDIHQMYHFLVVNTNQKKVDPGLEQQIVARFTEMNGVEKLPYLPRAVRRNVDKGADELAVGLAEFLNQEEDSPLMGRIQMANEEKKKRHRVTQASFVTIVKRHIFHGSNDMFVRERISGHEKMNRIVLNYTRAVDSLLVDPHQRGETRLYNNNGIYFLALISKWTFQSIYSTPDADFTVASISRVIKDALENLETDYIGIGQKEWWLPSPTAPALNRSTADMYSDAYLRALQFAHQSSQGEKQV